MCIRDSQMIVPTNQTTTTLHVDVNSIPIVIGRPVYVITVEHGGQTYNLCHEVTRRQEEDKPFDFEKNSTNSPFDLHLQEVITSARTWVAVVAPV